MEIGKISFLNNFQFNYCGDACQHIQVLLELAKSRNKVPLPKSISGPGIPLPPEQDMLIFPNYQLAIPKRRSSQPSEETEDDDEVANTNPNRNTSQNQGDSSQDTP